MYVCVFALVLNISCLTIFCVTALYRCEFVYILTNIYTYILTKNIHRYISICRHNTLLRLYSPAWYTLKANAAVH